MISYRIPILKWTARELNAILQTTWSPTTVAKDSFGLSAGFSGSVSSTAEGQRQDAINSTWQATALGKEPSGTGVSCNMISDMISCHMQDCVVLLAAQSGALHQQTEPGGIIQRQDGFGLAGGLPGVV